MSSAKEIWLSAEKTSVPGEKTHIAAGMKSLRVIRFDLQTSLCVCNLALPGYAALKPTLGSPATPYRSKLLRFWSPASIAPLLFDVRTQKLPTNLAHLSVQGARPLAIAQCVSAHGVIAREFVDASLVGTEIRDADTGIVGVCLCWWNAEGCQCYACCHRRAH